MDSTQSSRRVLLLRPLSLITLLQRRLSQHPFMLHTLLQLQLMLLTMHQLITLLLHLQKSSQLQLPQHILLHNRLSLLQLPPSSLHRLSQLQQLKSSQLQLLPHMLPQPQLRLSQLQSIMLHSLSCHVMSRLQHIIQLLTMLPPTIIQQPTQHLLLLIMLHLLPTTTKIWAKSIWQFFYSKKILRNEILFLNLISQVKRKPMRFLCYFWLFFHRGKTCV